MRKILGVLMAVFAVSLLSGCDQLRSPGGVLALAFHAVESGNLPVLKTTLKDEALSQYGDEQGLKTLQTSLKGQKLEIAKVWLKQSLLGHKDVRGTYIVKVRDKLTRAIMLKVTEFCYYGKPPRGFQDIEPNWDRCWVTALEFVH